MKKRFVASVFLFAMVADSFPAAILRFAWDRAHVHLSLMMIVVVLVILARATYRRAMVVTVDEVALMFMIKALSLAAFFEGWAIGPYSAALLWSLGFGAVVFSLFRNMRKGSSNPSAELHAVI